jgi:uncharacterized protein YuzE
LMVRVQYQKLGLPIAPVGCRNIGGLAMRVTFSAQTDTVTIVLNENPVSESDEEKPGVIIDYDQDGNIVALEILDASKRVLQPRQMVYELA